MDKLARGKQRVLDILGATTNYDEVIVAERELTTELSVNQIYNNLEEYLQSAVTSRLAVLQEQLDAFKDI